MKKIIFLIITAVIAFSSCKKDEGIDVASLITGCWELTAIDGADAPEQLSVYLDFFSDGSVCIYQKAGKEVMYQKHSGHWSASDGILKGSYEDGSTWASDYEVSVKDSELTLTSLSSPKEVTVYKKTSLPASVSDNVGNTL